MEEVVVRFLVGGVIVSAFAVLGDVPRPKTFAGIFAAAPSVALATLGLKFASQGGDQVATQGRSMVAGAAALCVYGLVLTWALLHNVGGTLRLSASAVAVWFGMALGLWWLALR
ncbi:MAG TPA: DUF3147 family protein [Chloroflexota bacterium]